MITSNSLKNNCPICNKKLFNYKCYTFNNFQNGTFFFNHIEQVKRINTQNKEIHLYKYFDDKEQILQYIRGDKNNIEEIYYNSGTKTISKNFTFDSKYDIEKIEIEFFNNILSFNEISSKINKIQVFL